jgi:gliding motility-associated-like protein
VTSDGYYYLDGLTLIDSERYTDISQSGDWCAGNLLLTATTDTTGGTWQWYKEGVALVGETDASVNASTYGSGNYTASYTVGANCLMVEELVDFVDPIIADFMVENVCLGDEVHFENTSFIPAYEDPLWKWSFGDEETSTDENPNHLYDSPGIYTVTLVALSDTSCNDTTSYEVTVHPKPVAKIEFITGGVSSEDGGTGTCIINPVQFNDLSTIPAPDNITEWSWNFGDASTSTAENPEHTYAASGTYTITFTVTTENGCSSTTTKNITMTDGISLEVIANEPTCFGYSDGSIVLLTSGAIGDLTFNITNADGETLNIDNSNAANSLPAGTYTFTVTDATACSGEGSITLNQPAQIQADFDIQDALCYNQASGIAEVDITDYQGPASDLLYFWAPNPAGVVATDSIWNLQAGEYTLTINDSAGCARTFDFTVGQPDSLYFAEFGFHPAYCRLHDYQSGNGELYVALAGGTPDYDYLWTNLQTGATEDNSTWGGLNPGQYEIIATDENGCVKTQIITLDSLNPIANFEMTSEQFTSNYEGTANVSVNFVNQSSNFANPKNPGADTTFHWNFDYDNSSWIISHDLFETFDTTYQPRGESYTIDVCLVASNKNGCTDTTCKLIQIYEPIVFDHVNIFTPNGDGANDVFTFDFRSASIAEFHCVIVDRWGTVVTELHDITDSWDGTNQNNTPCSNGVYFYTYQAVTDNGTELNGNGSVQLVGEE